MNIHGVKPVLRHYVDSDHRSLAVLWWRRYKTRRELNLLLQQDPERVSQDLGLDEFAVHQECRQWFWQPWTR